MKFTITLALAGEQLDEEQAEALAAELLAEAREHLLRDEGIELIGCVAAGEQLAPARCCGPRR